MIRSRVDWAVDEMKKLHDRVKEISLTAARFIRRASNRAVTFEYAMRKESLSLGTTT